MSKTELIVGNFDYSICTTDEKGKLIRLEAEVDRCKSKGAELVIELGKTLAIAQELLSRHKNGFLDWVERRGVSKTTAYRSMQVFRVFGDYSHRGKFEVTALYELAEKTTPAPALKEVLKLAEKGTPISTDFARKIIKRHTPKEEPNGKPAPTDWDGSEIPKSRQRPRQSAPEESLPEESWEPDETAQEETEPEPEAPAPSKSAAKEALSAYSNLVRKLAAVGLMEKHQECLARICKSVEGLQ